jgi:hypothetical protein
VTAPTSAETFDCALHLVNVGRLDIFQPKPDAEKMFPPLLRVCDAARSRLRNGDERVIATVPCPCDMVSPFSAQVCGECDVYRLWATSPLAVRCGNVLAEQA